MPLRFAAQAGSIFPNSRCAICKMKKTPAVLAAVLSPAASPNRRPCRLKLHRGTGHWIAGASDMFIYTLLSLGIFMCLLTCSGHIAAETANFPCLSCHMIFVFLLVILEGAITADVFLNSNWEEDFPNDPSGKFDEFKNFLRSNFEICEWVGLLVLAAQALSIILAMVLRALGPEREIDYDSDDDAVPARLPLLRNQAQHGANYVEPNLSRSSDSWSVRILDKANK